MRSVYLTNIIIILQFLLLMYLNSMFSFYF
jgi:hypothetical protein